MPREASLCSTFLSVTQTSEMGSLAVHTGFPGAAGWTRLHRWRVMPGSRCANRWGTCGIAGRHRVRDSRDPAMRDEFTLCCLCPPAGERGPGDHSCRRARFWALRCLTGLRTGPSSLPLTPGPPVTSPAALPGLCVPQTPQRSTLLRPGCIACVGGQGLG